MADYVPTDAYTHLLQPDTLLPSQYHAALRRKSIQEPERRLVIAILEDAVDCYTKHAFARDKRSQQLFQDAEEWILDEDRTWPFAFGNVCDYVGIEPEYLRRGLLTWRERAQLKAAAKVVPLTRRPDPAEAHDEALTRSA